MRKGIKWGESEGRIWSGRSTKRESKGAVEVYPEWSVRRGNPESSFKRGVSGG